MKNNRLSLLSLAVSSALALPAMAASGDSTEVIVISGSRLEQNLQTVAGSVVVMDEEEIARNMSSDFASLFRNEAAVDVKGGAGKSTSVTIRGIGGNRVMMVKDGVRVNNQYASPLGPGAEGTGRGLTEVEGLKQVEVVKAAASTIYGSDALGGVVVMQTKDASDYLQGEDHYASVNTGFAGVNNEFFAGFTAAAAYGDFENLIAYQRRDGEEQQSYDETLPDSDLVTDSILFKSKYRYNQHTNVQLTLDFLNQQLDRYQFDEDSDPQDNEWIDYDRQTQVFNGSIRIRSDKTTFAHDNMDVVVYYGLTDQNEWREYRNANDQGSRADLFETRDYDFEEQRYGFTSTFGKHIGNERYAHNLTYGFDIEQSEMSRPREYRNSVEVCDGFGAGKTCEMQWQTSHPFAFPDTESLRLGFFVQDDISLMDGKLNLVAGLRYDYFKNDPDAEQAQNAIGDRDDFELSDFDSMSEDFLSPKLGAVYALTDKVNVYAQYAYGYKMPTPDQKWGELYVPAGPTTDVLVQANYDLESESSHTYEIGVRGNHQDTDYELTLFYIQAKDYIDWRYVECRGSAAGCGMGIGELVYEYVNVDEVTMYGAEIQASHWLTDDLKVWGNLAYTYGEDGDGDYLNTISPMKGAVGMMLTSEVGDFNLVTRFAAKMDRTTDLDIIEDPSDPFKFMNSVYNTPGYAVVDLTYGKELTDNLMLRAGVYNLFDKEYVEYADVAGQSKFLLDSFGTSEEDLTQPGRHLSVNLRYNF
ncbi:TonB-dependent hemoglobin/transferrin/lactoferrin family receptor [Ferrimonas aestuarii]|uniref:TonB-dependent hemoglobin/transferrin/lactoferrin family receptor n=1 Tax=Ferrimonas aestuarii TaxID=2569539 RepID=A0A4U1BSP0_9GAMM|nr:TonB-dependent hemoglobin/transferrin/lactoferrin family receptor [Ferrimonas aestuarii]TKB56550.1 TonB-dependent hemoglobin/transferrin/lactoferrin family receptor [Ferrimonas aestuarii]